MARYNRRRNYRRRNENLFWNVSTGERALAQSDAGKTFLLSVTEITNFDQVCERVRGSVFVEDSGLDFRGILATVVLPETLLDGKSPGDDISSQVPNPTNNDGSDDFPLWQPVFPGTTNIDSKAKRRVKKDDVVATILRIMAASNLTSDKLRWAIRCLMKLKT